MFLFSKKLLWSLAALGSAAGIAGMGTFATFSSATSASEAISSGTVSISLGEAGTANNQLTIGAAGLLPGDTMQRRAKLTNAAGGADLASITLTTEDSTSPDTVLTTDATNGLQMHIERCGGLLGWAESSSTPYTYTCDAEVAGDDLGARSSVLASRAVIGTDLDLTGMAALSAGATDDLVVTVTLPTTVDNSFQGKTATIAYTFTGLQRAAASK